MPVYLIADKIIVFIKVFPIVALLFILPGFFLRKILNRFSGSSMDGAVALDFALGYSIFLIPGLITLYAMLSWTLLFIMWFALLVSVTVVWVFFCFNKVEFKLPSQKDQIHPSWQNLFFLIAVILLVYTFVILFLKGSFFTGDHQHHLAYVIKHLHTDPITPWVPMYKGTTEIPYNYAYDIHYLYNAVLVKLAGVDLNLYWDVSPSLYFIVAFSAYTHLYKKIMGKSDAKLFFVFFVLIFLLYQLKNWDPKIDFESMPIPDQVARNIFLPLLFAEFFEYSKANEKDSNVLIKLPVFLLLAVIMYIHLYSYIAAIFVLGAFTFFNFCFNSNPLQKAKGASLYIMLMLFSLVLFVLRTKNTTFHYYSASAAEIIDNYYFIIIIVLAFIFSLVVAAKKIIIKLAELTCKKRVRVLISIFLVVIFILSFIFALKYNGYLARSVPWGKYRKFLDRFELTLFTRISMVLIIISFLLALKNIKQKHDFTVLIFLISSIIVYIYAEAPAFNVLVSKFVTSVYSRRFVYLHEVYFIFIYLFTLKTIYNIAVDELNSKLSAIIKWFVLAIVLVFSIYLVDFMLFRFKDETYNRSYVLQEENVFKYINNNIEPWTVIASYNHAALDIVAQTPNYFISSTTVHSPRIIDEKERQNNTAYIFMFYKAKDDILSLLAKYDAEYILCEHNNDYIFSPGYSLEKFNMEVSQYQNNFIKIYSDQKYNLYEIDYQ